MSTLLQKQHTRAARYAEALCIHCPNRRTCQSSRCDDCRDRNAAAMRLRRDAHRAEMAAMRAARRQHIAGA
jgi:hypothetical protein